MHIPAQRSALGTCIVVVHGDDRQLSAAFTELRRGDWQVHAVAWSPAVGWSLTIGAAR